MHNSLREFKIVFWKEYSAVLHWDWIMHQRIIKDLLFHKINEVQPADSSTDRKLWIIILMEEVKPVVMEKFEFENYGLFVILFVHNCRRGIKHFDVHFQRIRSVYFLSKNGKDASYEGGNRWKRCLLPTRVGFFSLMFNDESTLPYSYLDLACKQLCLKDTV